MSGESPASGRITTDQWQRAEALFHRALALDGEARQAMLTEECADDDALRHEVESLLEAAEGSAVFDLGAADQLARHLDGLSAADLTPTEPHGPARGPNRPEHIGPYRLLDLLGEGGMGTVYLAEQSEPLPRQVALKLMRWGDAHGEAVRRFELEREAMARMSHPAIAQVFDAGATEHGQPYVVLEHIPGLPITTYCDQHRLDMGQRVALLAAVCDGVRHAHEKGIIHRDLKPSNILVMEDTGDPTPKIIDFGIAKALEPWSRISDSATASRMRLGSPGYMSPEAVLGGSHAIDTRSDVYSLGVVLCELLIGVRPFENRRGLSAREIRHADQVLKPPSQRWLGLPAVERQTIAEQRRVDERRLLRSLRGELDWIVLRAIAIDPEERYRSVAELAADLERWATGEPVEARPPSLSYRVRKTVRRHLVGFLAAAIVLATIIGFSIRSRVLYNRAEAARWQAESLVAFMIDDLSERLEPMGRLDLLEAVSRESLTYFESADRDLDGSGRRPAAALRQIGQVLETRGDIDAAFDAYRKALEIDRVQLAEQPDDPASRLDLAADLELLSRSHQLAGEIQQAEAYLAEAEQHLRTLIARRPEDRSARRALAGSLARRGAPLRRERGRIDAAAANLDEARLLVEALLADQPDDLESLHVLGDIHYGQGLVSLWGRGDAATAIEDFGAGATVFETLRQRQPGTAIWRYRLAVLKGQGLATSHNLRDEFELASAANREALSLLEVLVREQPSHGRWAHALGWELLRRGGLAASVDDMEAAAEAYQRAVEVQSALVARTTGPQTSWLDGLAVAYEALSDARASAGDLAAALAAAETSLATHRQVVERDPEGGASAARMALSALAVARLHLDLGDREASLALLDEVHAIIERLGQPTLDDSGVRADLADASWRRGTLLREAGLDDPAQRAFERVVELLEPLEGTPSAVGWWTEVLADARAALSASPATDDVAP